MQTATNHATSESTRRHWARLWLLTSLFVVAGSVRADPPLPGRITTFPAMQQASLSPGVDLTLRFSGFGMTGPYTFQWRHAGQDISGAVKNTLRLENVTMADAGEYTVLVKNADGEALSGPLTIEVDPTFSSVPILSDRNMIAAEWVDVNNDGWLDLGSALGSLRTGNSSFPSGPASWRILLNSRDGGFVPAGEETFSDYTPFGYRGYGDYDNDGLPDAAIGHNSTVPLCIYHNVGGTRFEKAWVGPSPYFHCEWADLNNDGYLDLLQLDPSGPARVHLNDRDGPPFHLVTGAGEAAYALTTIQQSYYTAWGDYDDDGILDLYATGYSVAGPLFHNLGAGEFEPTDLANYTGLASLESTWVDYDGDNDLDLVINPFYPDVPRVFRNDGDGGLNLMADTDIGDLATDAADCSVAMSWGDFDNDGDLDLYRTTMGPWLDNHYPAPGRLYVNQGGGRFARVTVGSPTTGTHGYHFMAGWGDYDNDGFLDLIGSKVEEAGSCVYRNNLANAGNRNHWFKVRCEGRVSNREAIGAKVRVKATIQGQERWQLRQIMRSGCDGSLVAHFGLGDATQVEVLRVEWPSGIVQEFHDLAVDQFKLVKEPPRLVPTGPTQFEVKCWPGMQFTVEASGDLKTWNPVGQVMHVNGAAIFTDAVGAHGTSRFYRVVEP